MYTYRILTSIYKVYEKYIKRMADISSVAIFIREPSPSKTGFMNFAAPISFPKSWRLCAVIVISSCKPKTVSSLNSACITFRSSVIARLKRFPPIEQPWIAPVVQLVSSTTLMPSILVISLVGPEAYMRSAHLHRCLSSGLEYGCLTFLLYASRYKHSKCLSTGSPCSPYRW